MALEFQINGTLNMSMILCRYLEMNVQCPVGIRRPGYIFVAYVGIGRHGAIFERWVAPVNTDIRSVGTGIFSGAVYL